MEKSLHGVIDGLSELMAISDVKHGKSLHGKEKKEKELVFSFFSIP